MKRDGRRHLMSPQTSTCVHVDMSPRTHMSIHCAHTYKEDRKIGHVRTLHLGVFLERYGCIVQIPSQVSEKSRFSPADHTSHC